MKPHTLRFQVDRGDFSRAKGEATTIYPYGYGHMVGSTLETLNNQQLPYQANREYHNSVLWYSYSSASGLGLTSLKFFGTYPYAHTGFT
jgi:hypothetical protein